MPRLILFRSLLILLALSTLNGMRVVARRRDQFQELFPGATGWRLAALVALAGIGLVTVAGLWFWRRWAVWAFAGTGVAILLMDLMVGAPVEHQAAAVASTLLVLAAAWLVRERFGAVEKRSRMRRPVS